jgi:hypothetical protein
MFHASSSLTRRSIGVIGKAAVAACALLLTCAGTAHAQLITFDDVPDGTVINNHYPGLQFTAVATGGSSNVYARHSVTAESVPNVVSLAAPPPLPFFDRRQGGVQVTFETPQAQVSLDVQPVLPPEYLTPPQARPFLQAFDSNWNFLGVVYYPISYGSSGYGSWQTLRIKMPTANIKYVQFASQYFSGTTPVYGQFDNLTYTPAIDVTSQVSVQVSGPYIRRISVGRFSTFEIWFNMQITNLTNTAISGPLQIVQTVSFSPYGNLTGVNGYFQGSPYVTYPGGLPAGGSVSLPVHFDNFYGPSNYSLFIQSLRIYSGAF